MSANIARLIPVSVPSTTIPCRLPSTRSNFPADNTVATLAAEEVRFTGLDARQDPQVWELVAATRKVGEVSVDVERRHPWAVTDTGGSSDRAVVLHRVLEGPVGEVDVLGERQPGETEVDCTRTGQLHRRARRGVPRPPRVHMVVDRRGFVHESTLVRDKSDLVASETRRIYHR